VLSTDPKYANQPVEAATEAGAVQPYDQDKAIVFKSANKHYGAAPPSPSPLQLTTRTAGVSRAFDAPIDMTDKTLVVQYEVKLTEGLSCGGAYLKLLKADDSLDLQLVRCDIARASPRPLLCHHRRPRSLQMNNDSPYVIMFGPDSCGQTNKVHFIFRHRNPVSGVWEEKHAQKVPAPIKDKDSHLYTLIIRPDNSYEM
jgi:calnexin